MTYRLYLAPNTYALTVQALLEELAVPHELVWVGIFQEQPDPVLLKRSPHLRVPALESDDGVVVETGAIALYVAERHGDGAFLIPPGDPDRARFLQWLHYLASTLQPDVLIQFHPEFYADDAPTQARIMKASMARLEGVFDVLNEALDPGPYFFGDRLTVLDFLFGMQATWPEIYPRAIDTYPNLLRHQQTLLARPAVRRTLDIHAAKLREQGRTLELALPL